MLKDILLIDSPIIKFKIMRKMKILFINTLLLLATFSLGAQDSTSLETFNGISVLGNIHVTLEKGEKPQAIIETYDISEDAVSVFVKNGVLRLQLLKTIFNDCKDVNVTVIYTDELELIKANAGAEITSKEVITSKDLEIRANAGAEIDLEIAVESLDVHSGEGAEVELSGNTQHQYAMAMTGGEYDGLDLQCEETDVRANTGGQAAVLAFKSLDASANTGGSIEYQGKPDSKSINSAITGKIRRIREVITQ